jgi:precorrin-2/cobalt-factor-2 C20-methyltransferase
MTTTGRLIGVGVGPGDPELLTLKAMRAIKEADIIVHFAKAGNGSNARAIVAQYLKDGVNELPLYYPITTEVAKEDATYRNAIHQFYEKSAALVAAQLDAGKIVAIITEGDPLFYGSYMHLHVRLAPHYSTEVIAGITAMSGCWSSIGTPIAQGDDVFTVLPGTLEERELRRRLRDTDAAVVMKIGRHLPKIRRALNETGRLDRAIYIERGTTADAVIMPMAYKSDDCAPYFAVVLVPGWEQRP